MEGISPATRDLAADLKDRFGFEQFLPGQRELMDAVLSGRDALGLMPTGGGKSLTYQLPALRLGGITVVVSPLIALMKDQVDAFNLKQATRAMAVAIHSGMTRSEVAEALAHVHQGRASLLYVAPERLEFSAFRARLQALRPRLLVIDEVHCVSLWGHDFRPSYMRLAGLVEALRPSPVLALTSTATPQTRLDILRQLGLREPSVFVAPLDRPNLFFRVAECDDVIDKKVRLLQIVRRMEGRGPQIVYVGRRADAEDLALDLKQDGIPAAAYHAGMPADRRKKAQDDWLAGRTPTIVATVAFGMGIDNPHVRAVTHFQHPASIEGYYQEAGRAGRDRQPSECTILFAARDTGLHNYFIRNRYPERADIYALWKAVPADGCLPETLTRLVSDLKPEQQNVAVTVLLDQGLLTREEDGSLHRGQPKLRESAISLDKMNARKNADYRRLEAMESYCREVSCCRANLLRYLGEKLPLGYRCGNCSLCKAEDRRSVREGRRTQARRAALDDLPSRPPRADRPPRARRAGRKRRGKDVSAGENGYSPSPNSGEVQSPFSQSPFSQDAADRGDEPVFWTSPGRSFTLEELRACQVPRKIGLAILGFVAANDGRLSPSAVANVLRGAATCDAVQRSPGLATASQFGAAREQDYGAILQHVLAMLAKDYLQWVPGGRKKLAITMRGRNVLTPPKR